MICPYLPSPQYLFFAEGVPLLLYYSHLPGVLVSLLVGFFVLIKSNFSLLGKLLFSIALAFSTWVLLDLILWTSNQSNTVFFFWAWFGILYASISLLCIYFFEVFLSKKDISFSKKATLLLLALPVIVLTPSKYNLAGFNLDLCGAAGYEGVAFLTYYTFLGALAMVWIGILSFRRRNSAESALKRQTVLMTIGIELFLFFFFVTGFLASYLNEKGLVNDYSLEQYGLFGMIIFMTFISYLIVRYKAFNIKLIGAQALLISLVILTGSQFFFVKSVGSQILTAITLVFTGFIGILLVRSVKKEVEQRERLEKITQELAAANNKLKELDKLKDEFLSFASHDLKSPVAKMKQWASLIYDKTYSTAQQIEETAFKITTTADRAIRLVDEFLNIRKLEEGRMEYNFEEKDVVGFVSGIVSDFQPLAKQKGLELSITSPTHAINTKIDSIKFRQVIENIIDNSLKYTEKGFVKVTIGEEEQSVLLTVSDSGAGIAPEVITTLFTQFRRDPNVVKTIKGTGLGLYIAKQIILAHKGQIWAESQGVDKGSHFFVRIPKI